MFLDHSSEKTLDKLKVLQVVEQFAVPLTNVQLTEFILEHDFVNYFSLQQCLTELVEASFLEYSDSEGEFYYLLTESGKNSVEFLKTVFRKTFVVILTTLLLKRKNQLLSIHTLLLIIIN